MSLPAQQQPQLLGPGPQHQYPPRRCLQLPHPDQTSHYVFTCSLCSHHTKHPPLGHPYDDYTPSPLPSPGYFCENLRCLHQCLPLAGSTSTKICKACNLYSFILDLICWSCGNKGGKKKNKYDHWRRWGICVSCGFEMDSSTVMMWRCSKMRMGGGWEWEWVRDREGRRWRWGDEEVVKGEVERGWEEEGTAEVGRLRGRGWESE